MTLEKKRVGFFGTPEFAVPFLNSLIQSDFEVVLVVSAPDKKVGRKQIITPSPVKQLAIKNSIDVLAPDSLKNNGEFVAKLAQYDLDIAVVVAYGKILPVDILKIPKKGFVNIHPSKLPEYRGPSPMQYALLNGDSKTAITLMQLDEGMDTGDILAQYPVVVDREDNYVSLQSKVSDYGSAFLVKSLIDYFEGNIFAEAQDDSKASLAPLIAKNDGYIEDFSSSFHIENMGRAYYSWPGISFLFIDLRIKIELPKAYYSKNRPQIEPGSLFLTDDKECAIMCGDGYVVPEFLQIPGRKKLSNEQFIQGYSHMINYEKK